MLSGQELPRTHWKRGVGLVNGFLGDAAGRLYVEQHFPASSKVRVETLVATLVAAFRQAITRSGWMSERGKAQRARQAVDAVDAASAIPTAGATTAGSSSSRTISSATSSARGSSTATTRSGVCPSRTRSGEWLMTPQTVNAYYNPVLNEIVVPAAMLQPPLFNADADDAANYGAIGAIVGHEIGHGFDDRGRRLDGKGARGELVDGGATNSRSPRLRRRSSSSSTATGRLRARASTALVTLRENVGDLSGLAIAWRAYKMSLAGRPSPVIDGFTGEQRFFLSWAQAWKGQHPRRVPAPDAPLHAARAARVPRERPGQQHGRRSTRRSRPNPATGCIGSRGRRVRIW